jgi:hypothetical protein
MFNLQLPLNLQVTVCEKDWEKLNEKDRGKGFRVPELTESEKDWKQTKAIEEEDELDDDFYLRNRAPRRVKKRRFFIFEEEIP